jgi:predicted RNA polymerase sigma factor
MGVLRGLEDLLRACTPQVLAAVVRRYGDFDTCEDGVQEALLAAARQWPAEGLPDDPRAWLIRVAGRRRVELVRSEAARTMSSVRGSPPYGRCCI